jgi:hypothetical protein
MQLAAVENDDAELPFFKPSSIFLTIILTAFGKNFCRLSS